MSFLCILGSFLKVNVQNEKIFRGKKNFQIFFGVLDIPDICFTGPRSAVGNVSGYRCVSDCRSRGREFDPGPVPYFRGD